MGMRAQFVIPVIVGIAVMMMLSVLPVMAISASGTIVFINPAQKHGTIERTDDGSNDLYQFRIPEDQLCIETLIEGLAVTFVPVPENSRHATNVAGPCLGGK